DDPCSRPTHLDSVSSYTNYPSQQMTHVPDPPTWTVFQVTLSVAADDPCSRPTHLDSVSSYTNYPSQQMTHVPDPPTWTVFQVTLLVLHTVSRAEGATIGWRWVVALAGAGSNSFVTCGGASSPRPPSSPVPIH
ncbi:hypothetical protein RRG08_065039, partial [Elysia crispata]